MNDFYRKKNKPSLMSIVYPQSRMDDKAAFASFSLSAKCIAEFIGTALFVFIGTAVWPFDGNGVPTGALMPALAHGLAIFILVTSLGHLSGGHFNPAVTLAIALCGKIKPVNAISYIVVQLAGGFFGALLTKAVLTRADYASITGGATILAAKYNWYNGLAGEAVATFMLVHTILLCAVDDTKWHAALAIGLTVAVDILALGHISGGSMNPARSFGSCLAYQIFESTERVAGFWEHHFIYWIGPILGAVIATGIFRAFYSRDFRLLK